MSRAVITTTVVAVALLFSAGTAQAPSTDPAPVWVVEGGPPVDVTAPREGDRVPLEAFPEPVVEPTIVRAARTTPRNRVLIPKIKAAAPIVTAPIRNGHAIVPAGHELGWVNTTRRPGAKKGTTLLAGHRDIFYGAQAGPLWEVEKLRKGDVIKVVWKGKTRRYKVTRITRHPRNRLPAGIFKRTGKHRLAITTCTGPYEYRNGKWFLSRNAVVWAKPVR